jgi:glucosamine 6-phosphate synthetase-like amidotransferase/phosphosugar isomerase protein
MCGIAGMLNVKPENREVAKRIFKSLVLANESRGRDSTGVLVVDKDSETHSLFKDTIPASQFLKRKKFRQVEGDLWLGHTRLATTGEVNERNAHPLNRKDTFLVHNGVISNHKEIAKKLDYEYEVDSEVLIPIVQEKNWDMLKEIKGSANFIAWDKNEDRIYVSRHDNPLYCLTMEKLGMIMFSSMKDVLEFVAGHYNSEEEPFEFTNDTLVVLDMKGKMIGEPKEIKYKKDTTLVKSNCYKQRYPSYYSDFEDDSWEDKYEEEYPWSSYQKLYENNKDIFCEGCGCEIDEVEEDAGITQWGYPLCFNCLDELNEVNDLIVEGKQVDINSGKWAKFESILKFYLPS